MLPTATDRRAFARALRLTRDLGLPRPRDPPWAFTRDEEALLGRGGARSELVRVWGYRTEPDGAATTYERETLGCRWVQQLTDPLMRALQQDRVHETEVAKLRDFLVWVGLPARAPGGFVSAAGWRRGAGLLARFLAERPGAVYVGGVLAALAEHRLTAASSVPMALVVVVARVLTLWRPRLAPAAAAEDDAAALDAARPLLVAAHTIVFEAWRSPALWLGTARQRPAGPLLPPPAPVPEAEPVRARSRPY